MSAKHCYIDANGGVEVSSAIERNWEAFKGLTNPSNTLTESGQQTLSLYNESVNRILHQLTSSPEDWSLVVTSGATESIMTAMLNGLRGTKNKMLCIRGNHSCVEEIANQWHAIRKQNVEILYGDDEERVVENMAGNGEFGAIFVTAVVSLSGEIIDSSPLINRFKYHNPQGLAIVDATQAVGRMPFNAEASGGDVVIFSGHKFGSLKGVGGLLIRSEWIGDWVPLIPGKQQHGLRGGTHNTHGVLSMAIALEEALKDIEPRLAKTRSCIEEIGQHLPRLPRMHIQKSKRKTLGNVLLIGVPLCSKMMAMALSDRGFDLGTGSACETGKASFVLRASLAPGQVIDSVAFVNALSEAYYAVLEDIERSLTEERKAL